MPLDDFRVHCPMCGQTRLDVDEQSASLWHFHTMEVACSACSTTFEVVYRFVRVKEVRYGQPIGPVYLTDDLQHALAAWEAEEEQWIRTDDTQYAVGYEPTVFQAGRGSAAGWRDTSPEELEAFLVQAVRP